MISAGIVGGAAAIVVAAITNPPYYGSSAGPLTAVATNAVDSTLMDQTHLVSLLIASYLLPLGFLTMAWMANRRSPWLASIGAFLSLMGFLPVALYAGQDSLYYDIAQLGSNPQFVTLAQYWNGDPIMSFYGAAFGLGSTIGPAFIGLALWRSGTVPRRAAALLIASRLSALAFPVVPYNVAVDIVLAGVVLFLVSSIPISLAVLRMPSGMNEEL